MKSYLQKNLSACIFIQACGGMEIKLKGAAEIKPFLFLGRGGGGGSPI